MVINKLKDEAPIKIKIGDSFIKQEKSAKLLGVKIEENQSWNEQINGKGGVISSLNQRLFLIKRLKQQINTKQQKKVANSIWTSKLRYGLQLYAKVRTSNEDPSCANMDALQKPKTIF